MKKHKGFTIIEVLVVVAVMTILVVMALVNVNRTRSQTRDKIRLAHLQEIRLAIEEYKSACGEYPARLELEENNGCPSGVTLGDFILELPVNPEYADIPSFYGGDGSTPEPFTYDGYLYVGLTNSLGGKCYEYHVGVPLESSKDGNSYRQADYFTEDHDCDDVSVSSEPYNRVCATSEDDFDGSNDTTYGLYDVRSMNNCS